MNSSCLNEFSSKGSWSDPQVQGEDFSHPGGAQSRVTASPYRREPVEVVIWSGCLLGRSLRANLGLAKEIIAFYTQGS